MDILDKKIIIENLSNYICFLNINGVNYPYTSKKEICNISIKNSTTRNKIKVFNLLSNKIEDILFEDVREITVYGKDVDNIELSIKYIDQIKSDVDSCCFDYVPREEILNFYLKNEVYLVNNEKEIFEICKKFKFTILDYEIKAQTISNIKNITNVWKEIIQEKITENIEELTNLKNETEDEEDIEDIDSIIEMFNDTISEIDLSDCKNLFDVIETYPPLLLPLPDSLKNIQNSLSRDNSYSLNEALKLVGTLTYDELKEIYNEVKDINEQSYITETVIDKIKNILDQQEQ
jgi:hypothetical protein